MKWTRYETLLPPCYNDERSIEKGKFRQTTLELIEQFSATTIDLIPALGSWRYRGIADEDALLRFVVDVPSSFEADDSFETIRKR